MNTLINLVSGWCVISGCVSTNLSVDFVLDWWLRSWKYAVWSSVSQTANEAALVLIVRLSKCKTSNVFVSTSSRSPPSPSLSLQVRPFRRCWTVNDWGLLQLRGVINFNKRPPRLSAFINEHLRAMDNLTTPLSPPWQRCTERWGMER